MFGRGRLPVHLIALAEERAGEVNDLLGDGGVVAVDYALAYPLHAPAVQPSGTLFTFAARPAESGERRVSDMLKHNLRAPS